MSLIPNIAYFRKLPEWGGRLAESLKIVETILGNISGQTNADLTSAQASAPPPINSLSVDGGNGIYHAYLTDNNQNLYRGAEYTLEYSDDNWQTYHVQHLGPAREHRLNLGLPGPFKFRAYSGYGPASPPSAAVYAEGEVSGASTVSPSLRISNGSGTNPASQGAGGYGVNPYRGDVPPRRA